MNEKLTIYSIIGILIFFSVGTLFSTLYYKDRLHSLEGSNELETVENESPEKDKEIANLRKKVKELERQLRERTTRVSEPPPPYQPSYDSRNASMEEIKNNDPDKYEKIIAHYTRMNKNISDGVQDKILFFSELDTKWMTDEQRKNHLQLIKKLEKLDEYSQTNTGADEEQLQEIYKNQRQQLKGLYKNMHVQKYNLMLDAGKKVGLSNKEAKALRDYIRSIEEVTSYRSFYYRKKKK